MKKILAVILSVAIVFCMCSCGKASPSDNAKVFLDALKAKDFDTMMSVYDSNETNENGFDALYDEMYEEMPKELADKIVDVLLAFDYEIKGEEIDGDKAIVFVNMSCLPAGDAIRNIDEDDVYDKAFDVYGDLYDMGYDIADEDIEEFYADYVIDILDDLYVKSFEDTVELEMIKKDGEWIVADLDDDSGFLNALGGGFGKAVDEL